MKVALEVWSSDYEQVRESCVLAESFGLDGFYYGESPNGLNLDCWTTLAGLAQSTDRIRLGPVITNVLPTYRSSILLAKQAATVHQMSGRRVDFRTGVGASVSFGRPWWEPFGVTYPNYDERLNDLVAALDVLPELWADSALPITIAASGQRAMTLAATRADVWETSFCTPAEFAKRTAAMTVLANGRPITRSLEIDGFVATTSAGVGRLLERLRNDRGKAENLDPILERALVGTPDQAAAQLRLLAAEGVDQAVVALHDPHDHDALEAIAETAKLIRADTT